MSLFPSDVRCSCECHTNDSVKHVVACCCPHRKQYYSCPECQLARANREIEHMRSVILDGIEAFRLTLEYVNVPDEHGNVLLPEIEGWSHYDWVRGAKAILYL